MATCTNTISCMIKVVLLLFIFSSFAQAYDYCSVLHDSLLFYEAQRSGRLPRSNRVPWRENSALSDSTSPDAPTDRNRDGNLAGGYYDSGDGVKFAFPLAFTTTTLSWGLLEFGEGIRNCGEHSAYLKTIKWATDWLLKAHTSPTEFYGQVGNVELDHAFWGPPERMTMDRPVYKIDAEHPGTDLAMEVASALAVASIVFNSSNAEYAQILLSHAREMYDFGYNYRGFYHDSIPDAANYYRSYGYEDEIVWASAWMYAATHEDAFLLRARADYEAFGIREAAMGQSFDWDQKAPGIVVLMQRLTGDSVYIVDAKRWMTSWKPGGRVSYTPGGLAWLRQWGTLRYTAASAFLSLFIDSADWGQSQIDYMLGSNPNKTSYVCGFGSYFPHNPHHRAAHGSTTNDISNPVDNLHVLTGALVGGPGQSDDYEDWRSDIHNEVALDYNAGFTAALAGLAERARLGTPDSRPTLAPPSHATFPPTSPPKGDDDYDDDIPTPSPSSSPTLFPDPRATPRPTIDPRPPVPTMAPIRPVVNETIELEVHQGSSAWWFAALFHNVSDVEMIEIMGSTEKTFHPMTTTQWGYLVYTSTQGDPLIPPLSFRLSYSNRTGICSLPELGPGNAYVLVVSF